eukprot:SAG22_NODE_783_length_7251_cov_18.263423_4_plen_94_part_00
MERQADEAANGIIVEDANVTGDEPAGWLYGAPFEGEVLDWWTGYTDSFFTIMIDPSISDSLSEKWFASVVGLLFNGFIFGCLTAFLTNLMSEL